MVEFFFNLTDDEFDKCKNFAVNSAKTQREYRSGGTQFRSNQMIEQDTFRGKIGEVVVKKFLEQSPLNISEIKLDFDIYPRGKWDMQDFTIKNYTISIKSAKWFSKWLLLETKDILRGDTYDCYILVTISKDYMSGTIEGYALKNDILQPSPQTFRLKKGDLIPGTSTILDASNYARHKKDLRNSNDDWIELINNL